MRLTIIPKARRLLGLGPKTDLYPYVYVNADGTARELHPEERAYLETEFKGGDGAAPYIKWRYKSRDGWGELSGYLKRSKLPRGMNVLPAPAEDPNKAMTFEEMIVEERARGMTVTENPDGTVTVENPSRR